MTQVDRSIGWNFRPAEETCMDRRRCMKMFGAVALWPVCSLAGAPQARLGIIGVGPSGSSLALGLTQKQGACSLVTTVARRSASAVTDAQAIAKAVDGMRSTRDVLVVAGLGGPWTSPMASLITERLQCNGQRAHVFATLPFWFEGQERRHRAMRFAGAIGSRVATLYPVELDVVLSSLPDDAPFAAFVELVADRLFALHLQLSNGLHA